MLHILVCHHIAYCVSVHYNKLCKVMYIKYSDELGTRNPGFESTMNKEIGLRLVVQGFSSFFAKCFS